MAETITWRRLDCSGHDYVRLEETDGWELSGTAIFASARGPSKVDYLVRCDKSWRTQSAQVKGVADAADIDLTISVREGIWRLNTSEFAPVAGCVDIDFDFTPATNLIPIRRLKLPVGAEAAVRAAWFRLSLQTLEPLAQLYRHEADRIYRYESGGGIFVRTLEVNDVGFVTNYPGLWVAEAAGSSI